MNTYLPSQSFKTQIATNARTLISFQLYIPVAEWIKNTTYATHAYSRNEFESNLHIIENSLHRRKISTSSNGLRVVEKSPHRKKIFTR